MACEHCVNRREFLARAAGTTSVAALLAACGDGTVSGVATEKPPIVLPAPVHVKVGNYPALANVGVLVQPNEAFVALKRLDATTFECFSLSCTHEGCLLGITNGQQFDCPCHFSRFDSNGNVLRNPATRPLDRFPTSYDPATDLLTIG